MSYAVWKAVLTLTDTQDIEVPQDAEFLIAREQHERSCVWFKCDPSKPLVKRRIAIRGTGHDVPEGAKYIGTCFLLDGGLVLHVFECFK